MSKARQMICVLFCRLAARVLALRYRVRVEGLEEALAAGKGGVLLLSSHPALIEPALLLSRLYPFFRYRPLADDATIARPVLGRTADFFGAIRLPDAVTRGAAALKGVKKALEECGRLLEAGGNVLIYPAGHILRSNLEEVAGNSAVETVLRLAPQARVVLVRVRGLWGSAFSRASGAFPDLPRVLLEAARVLLANLIFFAPRRPVTMELAAPGDFPVRGTRREINEYLDKFLNSSPPRNTYVPYYFWERGGIRVLPEPALKTGDGRLARPVPATVERMVLGKLSELSGRDAAEIKPHMRLAQQLDMDSLKRLELLLWISKEFGFSVPNPDMFETVADALAAAAGLALADRVARVKPAPRLWFAEDAAGAEAEPALPEGCSNIAEAFMARAAAAPDRPAIADQTSGSATYRRLIAAVAALKPALEKMPGERLGIMLPASNAAAITYLAALFAGKTPVMLNWTAGEKGINHMLALPGLRRAVASERLVAKLRDQGMAFGEAERSFVYIERLANSLSKAAKISAALRSYFPRCALDPAACPEPAVVLFTSGSESAPKAVPLSHANILANVRDMLALNALKGSDAMLGFLPPFHSFGLTLTVVLPLVAGIRAAYYPDPTDGGALARMIRNYKITVMPGTPTFINGILRGAVATDLASLRIAVTGAERCPEHVYRGLAELCPALTILEGYGVTECSPVISVNRPARPVPFSIGMPLPSLDCVVADEETGERCGPGRQGMLLVRGPSVFDGYLNHAGASPFVEFEGGRYYRTGDLVAADENGVLFFKGRRRRFVKLGGEMISLPAIEDALQAAFGATAGDKPVLAVEALNEDAPEITLFTTRRDLTRESANNALRAAGLSALHNIRRVEKLEQIPLLGTGKTDYRALKRAFEPPPPA